MQGGKTARNSTLRKLFFLLPQTQQSALNFAHFNICVAEVTRAKISSLQFSPPAAARSLLPPGKKHVDLSGSFFFPRRNQAFFSLLWHLWLVAGFWAFDPWQNFIPAHPPPPRQKGHLGDTREMARRRWRERSSWTETTRKTKIASAAERGARAPASPRESSGGRRVMRFMCHGGSKLKFHTTLSKAYLWEQFSYSCNISHPARSLARKLKASQKRTNAHTSSSPAHTRHVARTIRPTSGINYQAEDENSKDGNLEGKNTNVGTRVGGGGGGADLTRGQEIHSWSSEILY